MKKLCLLVSHGIGAFKDYLQDVLGYTEKETDDILDNLSKDKK